MASNPSFQCYLEEGIFTFESRIFQNEMIIEITMTKYNDEDSDVVNHSILKHTLYLESTKWPSFLKKVSIDVINFGIEHVCKLQDFLIEILKITVLIKQQWKYIDA